MQRRTLTLTLSGASVAVLTATAFMVPTPYAEMSPGPTYDTLGSYKVDANSQTQPVIVISGADAPKVYDHPGGGQLRMVTVEVSSPDYRPNSVEVLTGWLSND